MKRFAISKGNKQFVAGFIIGNLLLFPVLVYAVPLEVPIGGDLEVSNIAEYAVVIYNFIISIIGVLSAVMIMFAGLLWVGANGNSEKVGDAKQRLINALIGLVIALTSYVLLNTINPALVRFDDIFLPAPNVPPSGAAGTSTPTAAASKDQGTINFNEKWTVAYCEDTSDGPSIKSNAADAGCTGVVNLDSKYTSAATSYTAMQLLPKEQQQWDKLAQAFYEKYNQKIEITHAFRSVSYQKCLYDNPDHYNADGPAYPCKSNHNGGAAIDVNTSKLTQAQYNWINCQQEEECPYNLEGNYNRTAYNEYGWRSFNYNPNVKGARITEQHHFDYNNGTSTSAEVQQACPNAGCPAN